MDQSIESGINRGHGNTTMNQSMAGGKHARRKSGRNAEGISPRGRNNLSISQAVSPSNRGNVTLDQS